MPPLPILTAKNLRKYYGSEEIFDQVSFQLAERERVALVGVNGAGKSTILRIITGTEEPSAGEVSVLTGLRITYLPQEAKFTSDRTIMEEAILAYEPVIRSDARMREIEQALTDTTRPDYDALLDEYGHLQHFFEIHGGFEMEHRTEEILAGLGFAESQYNEPVAHLSGGQRTRVALAKALLGEPDLLLLDEPTNHLDLTMLEWLETFLNGWGGACLIVSHDRYFLDRVTTRTIELSFGGVEDYPAGYSGYLKLREERMERRQKEYDEQQEFITRTEEFIRKYKAGQRSREARGRQTRLDRLERIHAPQSHETLKISIAPAVRSGETVFRSSKLDVGYGTVNGREGRKLLSTPELNVERGDRIGIIGPNGEGKTTLLRTVIGELPPLTGSIDRGVNVSIGYYAQAHEQLAPQGTPISSILEAQPLGEESARNYLGRFLFSGDDVYKPVAALSGGERSRLALALLLLRKANVLVLDEPTNHLDVMSRESLESMLAGFDGTILFVSHDRYFADRIANRIWLVENGKLTQHLGNYSDFLRGRQTGQAPQPVKAPEPEPAKPVRAVSNDAVRPVGDGQRRKSIEKVEREISKLESRLNRLADDLAIAEVDQNYEAMARLNDDHELAEAALNEAYELWESLQEETAMQGRFA
ncbi:MAG: ABC-F family ATP-binding cassette domain-containing protein [Thermomicrobiales bacterium]|nr:ABC-F family ATP-binding cassette domain-containing protein [Thermomicrobiales bacterium]